MEQEFNGLASLRGQRAKRCNERFIYALHASRQHNAAEEGRGAFGGKFAAVHPPQQCEQGVLRDVYGWRGASACEVRFEGLYGRSQVGERAAAAANCCEQRVEDCGNGVRVLVAIEAQGMRLCRERLQKALDLCDAFALDLLASLCAL